MEVKKKFEKPELKVVEMKRNILGSGSCSFWCVGFDSTSAE